MKLKTLKDLGGFYEPKEKVTWYADKMIKAEAIKWVKERIKDRVWALRYEDEMSIIRYDAQMGSFREFFNITEEDLK